MNLRKTTLRAPLIAVAAVAGAAGGIIAILRRVAGSRNTPPEQPPGPAPNPMPANYDASGPPANTSTPLAAPPAEAVSGGIDEAAEEQAAAAAAGAIGGVSNEPLASSTDPEGRADPAEQPVLEGGGGQSEGREQIEAELADRTAAESPRR